LQRGYLYLRTGKLQEAETDLQQILQFEPRSAEAHFALAQVEELLGNPTREKQELSETIRLNAAMLPARLSLARKFIAAGQYQSAVGLLDEAPGTQKNSSPVVVERNWALLLGGNSQEARSRVNELLKTARLPDIVLQDGLLKVNERDFAGARSDAKELLKQDPGNVRAARLLIEAYRGLKQAGEAASEIRQLISQRPKSAPLQVLLAELSLATNNRADARAALEAAKRIDPRSLEADLQLAQLDLLENRYGEARQRLAGLIAANPRDVRALLLLGHVEMRANNRVEAIARYRSVLELDEANILALNNMAYLLAMDNPDEALKYAQQAVELGSGDPAAEDTLGFVYYRKALYTMAIVHLKTAVSKGPTPARKYHLGVSYLKAGDSNTGRQLVLTALQQDPNLLKSELGW
jgi:predicted Zn-dependent protease